MQKDFWTGVRDIAPILLGVIPFAMITGIVAVNTGLPKDAAMGMSLIIFAGASQLATVQLLSAGTAPFIVVLTAFIINMRFLMYSASMAPHLRSLSARWKPFFAYLLTDQAYAVFISGLPRSSSRFNKSLYYLGAAAAMWLTWQLSTAAGIFLGAGIPPGWGFDFAIPLTFMVLLFRTIDDRETAAAAVVGGTVAAAAQPLPFNSGLMVAALCGIGAGMLAQTAKREKAVHADERGKAG